MLMLQKGFVQFVALVWLVQKIEIDLYGFIKPGAGCYKVC